MADMLKQADMMQSTIDSMQKMQSLTQQMADATHAMVQKTKEMTADINDIRDNISAFDDFFRPIRSYFYWEKHCYDIPACYALRSIFDTLDGIDTTGRRRREPGPAFGAPGLADASANGADARNAGKHEGHENGDADHVFDPKGPAGPAERVAEKLERHG